MNPTPKNSAGEVDTNTVDLISQICGCLEGRVTVSLDNIHAATSFAELGVDSLSFLELVVDIEKTFGVSLSPDDAMEIMTIGDLEGYIRSQQSAASP